MRVETKLILKASEKIEKEAAADLDKEDITPDKLKGVLDENTERNDRGGSSSNN